MKHHKVDIQMVVPPSEKNRIEKQLWELDSVFIPPLTDRVNISEYAEKLANKAQIVYACENGKDCGHCAFYVNAQESIAFITSIAIEPTYQRRSIGKKLLECVKGYCFERGVDCVRLEVNRTNNDAIQFYQSMKFVKNVCNGEWIEMVCDLRENC